MSFKEMSVSGITGLAIWNCLDCWRASGPFIKSILLAHLDQQAREQGILWLKNWLGPLYNYVGLFNCVSFNFIIML